jgi:hypothetical protein
VIENEATFAFFIAKFWIANAIARFVAENEILPTILHLLTQTFTLVLAPHKSRLTEFIFSANALALKLIKHVIEWTFLNFTANAPTQVRIVSESIGTFWTMFWHARTLNWVQNFIKMTKFQPTNALASVRSVAQISSAIWNFVANAFAQIRIPVTVLNAWTHWQTRNVSAHAIYFVENVMFGTQILVQSTFALAIVKIKN